MTIRSQPHFVARLGALAQIVFAGLLGGLSSLVGTAEPDFLPRPLVLFGAYGLPGLIGLLAIQRRRPATLLAAGTASAVGSFLAFSMVTLIFLIPALLMLLGAAAVRSLPGGWADRGLGALRAALVLVLLLGAGYAALLITDERCWTWHETPFGVVMEPAPVPTGEMGIPIDDPGSGFGCSNGVISGRGVGLALVFGLAAVAVAGRGSRAAPGQVSGSATHSPRATPTATKSG